MQFPVTKQIQLTTGNWVEVRYVFDVFGGEIGLWDKHVKPVDLEECDMLEEMEVFRMDPRQVFTDEEIFREYEKRLEQERSEI
jgi:hypothetical protein